MSHEIKILLYIIIGIAYLFSRMYKKELKKQNEKKINKRKNSILEKEILLKNLLESFRKKTFHEEQIRKEIRGERYATQFLVGANSFVGQSGDYQTAVRR